LIEIIGSDERPVSDPIQALREAYILGRRVKVRKGNLLLTGRVDSMDDADPGQPVLFCIAGNAFFLQRESRTNAKP
jgi:hypothetical protein